MAVKVNLRFLIVKVKIIALDNFFLRSVLLFVGLLPILCCGY